MKIEGVDAPCDSPLRGAAAPAARAPASPVPVARKSPVRAAAAAAASAPAAAKGPRYFKVVYSGVVTVRDGPSRDASDVGERMKGDIVEAAEVSNPQLIVIILTESSHHPHLIESQAKDGWIKLQAPPGYSGDDRWVLTKVGTTLLLDEISASELPKREPVPEKKPAATGSQQSGGGCGFACWLVVFAVAMALSVLVLQTVLDGQIKTVYPAPQFSLAEMPDQSGTHALITGATSGIGKVMALELARRGAHVLVGGRDEAKVSAAVAEIIGETGVNAAMVEPLIFDLASLVSVKAAADLVNAKETPLNTLILNAGVMAPPFSLTKDGYETQFGVNHLGHFALATQLTKKLKAAPGGARVVAVSSGAHKMGYGGGVRGLFTEHFAVAINDESEYEKWAAYGQSKLCNILMASELARRMEGTKVYVNSAHPGFVKTDLMRHTSPLIETIGYGLLAMGPEDGALTPLFLATSPKVEAEDIRGQYYTPIAQRVEVDEDLVDPAIAKKLWSQSEKMVSEVLDEPDPDKYFVGKKSTKEDGRRSRLAKGPSAPVPPTGGGSTEVSTHAIWL